MKYKLKSGSETLEKNSNSVSCLKKLRRTKQSTMSCFESFAANQERLSVHPPLSDMNSYLQEG